MPSEAGCKYTCLCFRVRNQRSIKALSVALAIHADADLQAGQRIHPVFTGVLAALVGVDDLRFSVLPYTIPKQLGLVFLLQGVGNLPADDKPAVEIDHRCEYICPLRIGM